MKKQQIDHVLRAAGRITGQKRFVVIGSQSLHGTHPDVADQILTSFEVDLIAPRATEWLNAIGADSPFHGTFGYYADPVDESTATLPSGWRDRLVPLAPGDTEGAVGMCLEPHDLAIAKHAAARHKDACLPGNSHGAESSSERACSSCSRAPTSTISSAPGCAPRSTPISRRAASRRTSIQPATTPPSTGMQAPFT